MNGEAPTPAQAVPPTPPTGAAQHEQVTTFSVASRLKGQFAPAHLTLASIIQGVALSALVIRVEETYTRFDAVAWLLTAATFLVIVDIWHEDLMMVVAYVWLPTLYDSLIPFAFGAAELFLGFFVYGNARGWLLAYAGCYLVGVAAWLVQNQQSRLLGNENRDIKALLATQDRMRGTFAVALAVLCLLAWALYEVLHLSEMQYFVALAALISCGAFLASSTPGWNRLLAYARTER